MATLQTRLTALAVAIGVDIKSIAAALDPWSYVSLAADFSNSTVTLSDVTGMSFTAAASAVYEVEVFGAAQTGSTTTGAVVDLKIPSGTIIGQVSINTSATAAAVTEQIADDATTGVSGAARAANTNMPIAGRWLVSVGGTGGTVQLRFRSSKASPALLKGGLLVMKWRKAAKNTWVPPPTPALPTNTSVPTVSGTPLTGSTLTSTPGVWAGAPSSYAYQWQESIAGVWTNISGATASTYTTAHAGDYRSTVVASNLVGSSTAANSTSTTVADASGSGVAGGKGAVVQKSAGQSFNSVAAGAHAFSMPANLTAGNSAVVVLTWYNSGGARPSAVSIGGTAATKIYQESGSSTAASEYWQADALAGGSSSVSITLGAGTGQYLNACCIETTPLGALDQSVTSTGTSTTPTITSSAALDQLDELVLAAWRDNDGVLNTAGTPVTSPLTQDFFVSDGATDLGGAGGHMIQTARAVATGAFAASPAAHWYGTLATVRFAMPVVDCGQAAKFWHGSAWTPTTIARAVASGTNKLLVAVGGWWDDQAPSAASALPTDSTGATFTAVYNPTKPDSTRPVVSQISYIAAPSTATHTITPPNINMSTGDGYLALLEIPGIDTSGSPVRDKGRTFLSHAPVTPPDAGSYQAVTVTTDGALAQVGDVAILAVTIDMNSTPANVNFVPPAGWQMVRDNYDSSDNISFLVCTAKVTTAGTLSATVAWTDPNTFIVDAQMVVFKHQ